MTMQDPVDWVARVYHDVTIGGRMGTNELQSQITAEVLVKAYGEGSFIYNDFIWVFNV